MPSGIRPTDEMIQKIKEMTDQGCSRSAIGKEIGYSSRTVARYQAKMGYFPNKREPYERKPRQVGLGRMSIRFYGYGSKFEYELNAKDKVLEITSSGSKSIRLSLSLIPYLISELEEITEQLSNLF